MIPTLQHLRNDNILKMFVDDYDFFFEKNRVNIL